MIDDIQIAKTIREAIKAGDVDQVMELLDADRSRLQMKTPFGTWLHVAARQGQLEIVKRLIALGLDINAQGGIRGGKPVNEATAGGHLDVVAYLLEQGTDLDTEQSEQNPLFTAIYCGHTAIAKLLIDGGIDTDARYTDDLMDAHRYAREYGRTDIVNLLKAKHQQG